MNWLTLAQQAEIREAAAASSDRETCGFVLTDGSVIEVANIADDPVNCFEISPAAYAANEQLGIAGIWHSHLDLCAFSPKDQEVLVADPMPWAIYCLANGQFVQCNPGAPAPFLGRPFVYGIYDCYSLVSDMLQEMGVQMPSWSRGFYGEWNEPLFAPFDTEASSVGMPVSIGEQRRGDILLFNLGDHQGHTDHVGVFLDDKQFLHHPAERRSRVDSFGGWWSRRLRMVVRPWGLC